MRDSQTLPALTLVIGAARSGKSRFAETLARASALPRCYIATAQAFDAEMEARIAQHRLDRGADWHLIEAPLDLAGALHDVPEGYVTLVDCATLWLSNHLLADHDLAEEGTKLLAALAKTKGPVIIVSNEVGAGIVPADPLTRRFRDEQGRLNQRLAAQADLAVLVAAGLPLTLKGRLPEGLLS